MNAEEYRMNAEEYQIFADTMTRHFPSLSDEEFDEMEKDYNTHYAKRKAYKESKEKKEREDRKAGITPDKPLKYYEDPNFHEYDTDKQRDYWRKYGKVMNIIWWIGFAIINVYWVVFTADNPEAIIELSIAAFFAIYAFYIVWGLFIWIPYAFDVYPEAWSNHKFIHSIGIVMLIVYWIFRIIGIIGRAIGINPA